MAPLVGGPVESGAWWACVLALDGQDWILTTSDGIEVTQVQWGAACDGGKHQQGKR